MGKRECSYLRGKEKLQLIPFLDYHNLLDIRNEGRLELLQNQLRKTKNSMNQFPKKINLLKNQSTIHNLNAQLGCLYIDIKTNNKSEKPIFDSQSLDKDRKTYQIVLKDQNNHRKSKFHNNQILIPLQPFSIPCQNFLRTLFVAFVSQFEKFVYK